MQKQKGMAVIVSVLVLVAIVAVGMAGYYFYEAGQGVAKQKTNLEAYQEANPNTNPQPPNPSQNCAQNPSVVSVVSDALQPGISLSPTNYYITNGQYAGTTSPTVTGSAKVLVTNTSYLSAIVDTLPLNCGTNQLTTTLYAYSLPTVSVYSNNGLAVLTNSATGGVYNETHASAGGTLTWKYHMLGNAFKSTGSLLFVAEVGVPNANVSSITLTGGTPTTALGGYSSQVAGSAVKAWVLPAIVGGTAQDYYLSVTGTSGKLIEGTVYTTIYALEPFVEIDGSFNPGNKAWDNNNGAKYHSASNWTYNWLVV